MRKIPVFVSCPTSLTPDQDLKRKVIIDIIDELQLEPRALGRSDYPKDFPLKEVTVIARHCSGGVILGFEQIEVTKGIRKKGTPEEKKITSKISLPTPWNHLEAGILYALKIPLLIFKENGIEGGVFDHGITDVFVHSMPEINPTKDKVEQLKQVFMNWYGEVNRKYYTF